MLSLRGRNQRILIGFEAILGIWGKNSSFLYDNLTPIYFAGSPQHDGRAEVIQDRDLANGPGLHQDPRLPGPIRHGPQRPHGGRWQRPARPRHVQQSQEQ